MNRKRTSREALLAYLLDEPWALPLATLSMIVDRVMNWPDMEWAAAFGRQPAPASRAGTIAIIPVYGMIGVGASVLDEFLGVTSVGTLRSNFQSAMADPNARAIVFDIDSPGGGVAGIAELANEIRESRGRGKAIIAHGTLAASAAYWGFAGADEFVVSPSGSVGSVGVVAVHQEFSKALEDAGVTTTIISSGEFKTEGNKFEPLTDEAKAHLQERSDTFHAQFVADVAKGRGTTAENVRSNYGRGRLLLAQPALKAGMVDRIEAFDATLARLSKSLGGAQPSAVRAEDEPIEGDDDPIPFHERAAALARESDAVVAHAATRIELRTKENDLRTKEGRQTRALLSTETTSALRTSRDALSTLLATVEPEQDAAKPVEPAPVITVPPVAPKAISAEEFRAKLTKRR